MADDLVISLFYPPALPAVLFRLPWSERTAVQAGGNLGRVQIGQD